MGSSLKISLASPMPSQRRSRTTRQPSRSSSCSTNSLARIGHWRTPTPEPRLWLLAWRITSGLARRSWRCWTDVWFPACAAIST